MKQIVFAHETCYDKIKELATPILKPLEEIRFAETIFCSGNWIEKLAIEIEARTTYIFLSHLKLNSKEETNQFIELFNRSIKHKVPIIIYLLEPMPDELKGLYLEIGIR